MKRNQNKFCFIGSCHRTDTEFSPKDDISGESRTSEGSASACQARCVLVPSCGYFSYLSDGGCHLSGAGAVAKPSTGVTSGPSRCPGRKTIKLQQNNLCPLTFPIRYSS